jgi:hypothetical protein
MKNVEMSIAEARNHPELHGLKCRVKLGAASWWINGVGTTKVKSKATWCEVGYAIGAGFSNENTVILVIDEVPDPKLPEGLTSTIELVLPKTIIELLKAQPENATIRTHVLVHTKVPIPDEFKTYDAIKDWIEHNIKPNRFGIAPGTLEPFQIGGCSYSETEIGNCRYRVERVANNFTHTVKPQDLLELVKRTVAHEGDLDSAISDLDGFIRDRIYEDPPNTEADWDRARMDRHEADETTDSEASAGALHDPLVAWLQANAPQLLAQLNGELHEFPSHYEEALDDDEPAF